MKTLEIIVKKRDGKTLSKEDINHIVLGIKNKKIPDYQAAAFLMAVYINGMNERESRDLTHAMLHSGLIIDLSEIEGLKIGKHSTGGVGDKTSLIITPIAVAAGVKVPQTTGRALGHTGGTLDKLESIPGFDTVHSLREFKLIMRLSGAVFTGQSKYIAPADKHMYALRDVTGTVASIPLITASIMSKKLAEGIDGLVLDVKCGNGTFMETLKDAEELAKALSTTTKEFGKKNVTFITDMNQPLGNYIGNWLEVYESIKLLQGENIPDLLEVSLNLAGAMIYLGEKAESIKEGIEIAKEMISSGKAFDAFINIVQAQGGHDTVIYNPEKYFPMIPAHKLTAQSSGFISLIDTKKVGYASHSLGAGRFKKGDKIEPFAGLVFYPKIGDEVKKGDVLADIYTKNEESIDKAISLLSDSVSISDKKTRKPKLIKKILS